MTNSCQVHSWRSLDELRQAHPAIQPAAGLYTADHWLSMMESSARLVGYLVWQDPRSDVGMFFPCHTREWTFTRRGLEPSPTNSAVRLRIGSHSGYRNELRLIGSSTRADDIAALSPSGVRLRVPYVPCAQALALAAEGVVVRPEGNEAFAELRGFSTLDDYVSAMSSGQRSDCRRELRRLASLEFSVESGPLSACSTAERARLRELLMMHNQKYAVGPSLSEDDIESMLGGYASLGCVAARLWHEGAIRSLGLYFMHGDTLWVRQIATDNLYARRLITFESLIYTPVKIALQLGLTRLHLGTGDDAAQRTKVARGAVLQPLYMADMGGRRADLHEASR